MSIRLRWLYWEQRQSCSTGNARIMSPTVSVKRFCDCPNLTYRLQPPQITRSLIDSMPPTASKLLSQLRRPTNFFRRKRRAEPECAAIAWLSDDERSNVLSSFMLSRLCTHTLSIENDGALLSDWPASRSLRLPICLPGLLS